MFDTLSKRNQNKPEILSVKLFC